MLEEREKERSNVYLSSFPVNVGTRNEPCYRDLCSFVSFFRRLLRLLRLLRRLNPHSMDIALHRDSDTYANMRTSVYIVGFSGRQSIWMLSERRWLLSDKFAALGSALYLRAPATRSHWLMKAKTNILSANGIAEICKGLSCVQVSYMAMSS